MCIRDRSRSTITNLLRLLSLSSEVQELLQEGKIEMGHARALLTLNENDQLDCAMRVVSESLSVRECEVIAAKLSGNKKNQSKTHPTKDPNTVSLEKELTEVLGSAVEIKHNKKGNGKLIISYKSLAVLQGIVEKIK